MFLRASDMNMTINDPGHSVEKPAFQGQSLPPPSHGPKNSIAMALHLAHAENALNALAAGQVDAIVGPKGKTYLLHGAQEDLRRSEMGLRALFDSVSDLITVINRSGVIVSQNRAAVRILGCEPESLLGRSLFQLIHSDDLAKVRSAFFGVIDEFQDHAAVEFRHLTGDGAYRKLEAMVSKLRDASVSRVIFICRDMTRRRNRMEDHSP
jgi:PAS domain S-box-containing protein